MRLPSLNMWPFHFMIAVTENIWFMFSFEIILSSTAHFLPILCLVGYLKAVLSLHHRNQISIVDDSFPTKLVLICIFLHNTEIIKIQSPQIIYFLGITIITYFNAHFLRCVSALKLQILYFRNLYLRHDIN